MKNNTEARAAHVLMELGFTQTGCPSPGLYWRFTAAGRARRPRLRGSHGRPPPPGRAAGLGMRPSRRHGAWGRRGGRGGRGAPGCARPLVPGNQAGLRLGCGGGRQVGHAAVPDAGRRPGGCLQRRQPRRVLLPAWLRRRGLQVRHQLCRPQGVGSVRAAGLPMRAAPPSTAGVVRAG